jgi:site-specific recombinase XerC
MRRTNQGGGSTAQFRFHDLRHYFASLLIASGLDVKVVQARLRHASAKTTLDIYGHLWPDKDESSRAAVAAVYALRAHSEGGSPAESLRNRGPIASPSNWSKPTKRQPWSS